MKIPLILDGAMGTELKNRGVKIPLPLWSAEANVIHPDIVKSIHQDYIFSGADIITTNTFRTTSWTYKKSNGTWEIYEPIKMLNNFFNNLIFQEYQSQNVYVLGFSQGAAVCYEYVMGIEKTLGGIFPIGGC